MLGAYAIFKREDGVILHREVMCESEIDDVRAQSKAKESLMWTKFKTEGWRKSVIRRGIKTVPVSESLEQVVHRDDELFDFGQTKIQEAITAPPSPPPAPPPAPKAITNEPAEVLNVVEPISEETEAALDRVALRELNGVEDAEIEEPEVDGLAVWFSQICADASKAIAADQLDEMDKQVSDEIGRSGRKDLQAKWNAIYFPKRDALKQKARNK